MFVKSKDRATATRHRTVKRDEWVRSPDDAKMGFKPGSRKSIFTELRKRGLIEGLKWVFGGKVKYPVTQIESQLPKSNIVSYNSPRNAQASGHTSPSRQSSSHNQSHDKSAEESLATTVSMSFKSPKESEESKRTSRSESESESSPIDDVDHGAKNTWLQLASLSELMSNKNASNSDEREMRLQSAKQSARGVVRTRREVAKNQKADAIAENEELADKASDGMPDDQAHPIRSTTDKLTQAANQALTNTVLSVGKKLKPLARTVTTGARVAGEATGVLASEKQIWSLPPKLAAQLSNNEVLEVWREIDKARAGNEGSVKRLRELAKAGLPTANSVADPGTYLTAFAEGRSFKSENALCESLLVRIRKLNGGAEAIDDYKMPFGRLTFDDVLAVAKGITDKDDMIRMNKFIRAAKSGFEAA